MIQAVEAAVRYAALGWKIVLLEDVVEPKQCSCRKGKDCPSPGKHPRFRNWLETATNNEETIYSWGEQYPNANYGLILGPSSGVIDIEYDTEEGKETIKRLGLDQVVTPTYKSARSVHRLFKWTGELPDVQKVEINGLEIRIGGGGKSTQSVLPPSRHPSGVYYEWVPALSALEVEAAEVPDAIIAACHNLDPSTIGDRPPTRGREALDLPQITEGNRNEILYAFACREARLARNIDDPQSQADIFDKVAGMNLLKCKPPVDVEEVKRLVRSAIEFIRRQTNDPDESNAAGFTLHGLRWDAEKGWSKGDWKNQLIESDPIAYRLTVPAWKDKPGGGVFVLSVEQFRDHVKVAAMIQSVTGDVCLDDQPKYWAAIWNGKAGENGYRGLRAQLLDGIERIPAPSVAKRFVAVAEIMQEQLDKAHPANDADAPDGRGAPMYRADGSLWFSWKRVWDESLTLGKVKQPEIDDLRRRLGLTNKNFRQWPDRPTAGQRRLRYCVLKPEHLDRLRDMTEETAAADEHEPAR